MNFEPNFLNWMTLEEQLREVMPINGFAFGDYLCRCNDCYRQFPGDKRAYQCLSCAIKIMKTDFKLNHEELKRIYRAGMRRGQEESSAYEWGTTPWGKEYDEFDSELADIKREKQL